MSLTHLCCLCFSDKLTDAVLVVSDVKDMSRKHFGLSVPLFRIAFPNSLEMSDLHLPNPLVKWQDLADHNTPF